MPDAIFHTGKIHRFLAKYIYVRVWYACKLCLCQRQGGDRVSLLSETQHTSALSK